MATQKKQRIDFQDGGHGNHLGIRILTILAFYDLQVTLTLPTEFQVNTPFGSKEAKNRFSRCWPCRPSWISDRNDFSYFFDPQVTLLLLTKFQVNWPFVSGEEVKN